MSEPPQINDGWRQGVVADIAEINPSTAVSHLTMETPVSFITMADVSENGRILNRQMRRFSDVKNGFTRFQESDVLFAKITPCMENGKGAFAVDLENHTGFGSTEFHVLRAKPHGDAEFLYHLSQYNELRKTAVSFFSGSAGQQRVSPDFFRRFHIKLPPLPEQRKIASILTTVDWLIEQTEALIEKYRRVKQGMMADLLSRGVDSSGKLRPTQRQAPQLYKQSELGWIPKEWEVETLGDIARFDSGYAFKERELTQAGAKVVRITNLHRKDFPYWRYEGPTKPTWVVESGDLLFSWAGVASSIDAYLYSGEAALLNQHIYNFRIPDSKVKRFVYHYLKFILPSLRINIEGGAGQLHLTKDKIQSIAIPRPKDNEHGCLLEMMESLNARMDEERLYLTKLRTLKTGLMQDLLTGKVRVKVDQQKEVSANA